MVSATEHTLVFRLAVWECIYKVRAKELDCEWVVGEWENWKVKLMGEEAVLRRAGVVKAQRHFFWKVIIHLRHNKIVLSELYIIFYDHFWTFRSCIWRIQNAKLNIFFFKISFQFCHVFMSLWPGVICTLKIKWDFILCLMSFKKKISPNFETASETLQYLNWNWTIQKRLGELWWILG